MQPINIAMGSVHFDAPFLMEHLVVFARYSAERTSTGFRFDGY